MFICIAIVENEMKCTENIKNCLDEFQKANDVRLKIVSYNNAIDFLDGYKPEYDLVFMDIDMPVMDGLYASKKLRLLDRNVCIVFVTYLAQYAIKGYEVNALDYVIKPAKYINIANIMKKVIERAKFNGHSISLITNEHTIKKISTKDIVFLEVYNNNVIYHTIHEDIMSRVTLAKAEEDLIGHGFIRCHRCYVVNQQYVTDILQNEVVLGKTVLMISRPRKKEFVAEMIKYWGKS